MMNLLLRVGVQPGVRDRGWGEGGVKIQNKKSKCLSIFENCCVLLLSANFMIRICRVAILVP